MVVTIAERKARKVAGLRLAIEEVMDEIRGFARRHGGRYIVFGSVARGDLRPDSDLDLVVDFPPGTLPEARAFAEDACARAGVPLDAHEMPWLPDRLRARIAKDATVAFMDDARWEDVEDDVAHATLHFSRSLGLAEGPFEGDGLEAYRNRMALLHSLQSGHNAAEAALRRVLHVLREDAPAGEDWPRTLIDRLARPMRGDHARPALLDAATAADLHETRAFRHRALGDVAFDPRVAVPALGAARRLASNLPAQFLAFRQALDGGDGSGGGMSAGPR